MCLNKSNTNNNKSNIAAVTVLDESIKATLNEYSAAMISNLAFTLNTSPITFDNMPELTYVNLVNGRGRFPDDLDVQSPLLRIFDISRLRPKATNEIARALGRMEHLVNVDLRCAQMLLQQLMLV